MPPSEYVNELCSVVGILHLLVYRLSWYGLTSWEWEQLLWPSQLAFDGVLSPIRALSGSGKTHPAQFIYNQSSDQLETWLGVQTIRIGFAQCVSVLWTLYSFTHLLALTIWSQVTWRRTNFVTRNILWHIEKYVFPFLRVPLRGCFLMGFPIYAALCLCAPCGNKGWRPRLKCTGGGNTSNLFFLWTPTHFAPKNDWIREFLWQNSVIWYIKSSLVCTIWGIAFLLSG